MQHLIIQNKQFTKQVFNKHPISCTPQLLSNKNILKSTLYNPSDVLARTFPMVIMVLFKKKNFTIDIVWILAERFSCFNELQKGGSENCDQEMLVWQFIITLGSLHQQLVCHTRHPSYYVIHVSHHHFIMFILKHLILCVYSLVHA